MLKIVEEDGGFNVMDQDTGEVLNKKPFGSREEAQTFLEARSKAQEMTRIGAKPSTKPTSPMGATGQEAALASILSGAGASAAPPMPPGLASGKKPLLPGAGM